MPLCYNVVENKNKFSHWEQPEIWSVAVHWLNFLAADTFQSSYLVIDEFMMLNWIFSVIQMMNDWEYFLIQPYISGSC